MSDNRGDRATLCQTCKVHCIAIFKWVSPMYVSNGTLSQFSHSHYTNWEDMWSKQYAIPLVIQSDQGLYTLNLAFPLRSRE